MIEDVGVSSLFVGEVDIPQGRFSSQACGVDRRDEG